MFETRPKGRVERLKGVVQIETLEETCRLETRNLGTNGNCYIFTELIEDVMEEVYKVEFGDPMKMQDTRPAMI